MVDNLYTSCDFTSHAFKKALSRKPADGGLNIGRLVFADDFERFMGKPYKDALAELTGSSPNSRNLGGCSLVSLAHAAQILQGISDVRFFGVRGNSDAENGAMDFFENAIKTIPFKKCRLAKKELPFPGTDVLSDPDYDNGHGERTFICQPGAGKLLSPADIDDDFFAADIIGFGGTALVPHIHNNLTELLKRAKAAGAITVINLVYDFFSELKTPGQKWKLGANDDAYPFIDVLIADKDEAIKTSGASSVSDAIRWFISQGAGAVIVTEGSRSVTLAASPHKASGGVFSPVEIISLPVCEEIDRELAAHPERRGDTTGCGDNFAGGVIVSIAEQLAAAQKGRLDLRECVIHGTAAGGFSCFTAGGAFIESHPGEKRKRLEVYINAYRKQLVSREYLFPV